MDRGHFDDPVRDQKSKNRPNLTEMLPFGNIRAVVNLNEIAPGVNLNRNAGRVNLNEIFRSVNLNKSPPRVNLNERSAMRSFVRLHPHRPADQGDPDERHPADGPHDTD